MLKKISVLLALGLLTALAAGAQTKVRGQIFLPNGETPRMGIRFFLQSADGRVNEYMFTDSNGRFNLDLSPSTSYSITVESDGSTFATTVYEFIPSFVSTPRVILKALKEEAKPASKYKSDAVEMHESAMKDLEKNNTESAEKKLRRAVEIDPTFVAALNDLGVLLMQKKNYAEAERIFRKALAQDANSVHSLLNLGITLNHLQRYRDAVEPLREAIALESGLIAAHVNLGVAYVELDRFLEAEPELQRGAKAGGGEEIIAQLYLGKLYARTGQYPKSIAAFEAYLAKSPNSPNAAEVRQVIERMKREMHAPTN